MRKQLSSILICLLTSGTVALHASPQSSPAATLKQQIVLIPVGNAIEVRFNDKTRIRGRIGAITDESFVVTIAEGNRLDERTIAYSEVKAIKLYQRASAGKTTAKILLGVAAVVGAVFVVVGVIIAAD